MEATYEHRVRVRAPVEVVWSECAEADRVLRHAPEVVGYEVAPSGDEGTLSVRLAWGRFEWNLDGRARVAERVPSERVAVDVDLPGLGIAFTGCIELSEAADDEVNAVYRGSLTSDHPLVNRLKAAFADITETHVRATVEGLAAAAERRWQAEEQLLRRFGPAGS